MVIIKLDFLLFINFVEFFNYSANKKNFFFIRIILLGLFGRYKWGLIAKIVKYYVFICLFKLDI